MKKTIVSVTTDLVIDQRVHKVCLFLKKRGLEVILIGRKRRKSLLVDKRSYVTRRMFLFFDKGPLFYAEYNIRLFFFLLFRKADVLVSNDLDTLLPNYLISKIKRTVLVYDSHEFFTELPELQERKFIRGIWKCIEGGILPKIKHCYTVSKSIAEAYEKKYKIQMRVVRNVPMQNTLIKLSKSSELLESLHRGEKKIIMYQGTLNIGRGIYKVLDAMLLLENVLFVIVGDGYDLENIKKRVDELELSNKVKFTGEVPFDQLAAYTCRADIGLLLEENMGLSYLYSLPNKLFDFIHAGVPVLASPLFEIKKIFENYEIGEMIENHYPGHIAEKIKFMLNNKEKIIIWKENLKNAAMEYCWENEEKELEKIYFCSKISF
ncbi:MAG: glycosyltransferase [Bacteroidota bacterium]